MGGGSSSSQSSSTSQTEQYDQRVAASEQGIAVGPYANVRVDLTDPRAFELTGNLLKVLDEVGATAIKEVFDFAQESQDFVKANNEAMQKLLAEQGRSESASLVKDALKIALPLGLGFILVKGLADG